MTTFFNRIPKMILTITALTFGAAGVAVASPSPTGSQTQYVQPQRMAQAGTNTSKVNRKQAKQKLKKQRKQAKRKANKQQKRAQRMAKFDSNHNGKIDKGERITVRQQRFVALDTNRNGSLTLAEMQAAKAQRRATKQAQRAAKRAQRVAALSEKQQAKHAKRRAKRMAKRNARPNKANKPGLAKRFAKLDANHDGSVSRSEFLQGKGKRKGKRGGKGKRRGKRQRS